MHLLPALRVLRADGGPLVEQRPGEHGVGPGGDGEVEGREPLGVAVVGGGAELQEGA